MCCFPADVTVFCTKGGPFEGHLERRIAFPVTEVWSQSQERRPLHSELHTHFSVNGDAANYPPAVSNYLADCMHDVTHDPRRVPGMLNLEVQVNTILRST